MHRLANKACPTRDGEKEREKEEISVRKLLHGKSHQKSDTVEEENSLVRKRVYEGIKG